MNQTPDPAVCLVSCRISVRIVLVAGDRVVPVNDVNRSVGPLFHVHRTEVAVPRLQDRFLPLQRESRTVGANRKPLDPVGLEIADHEVASHRFRNPTAIQEADATVSARVSDPPELQLVGGGHLPGRQVGHAAGTVDAENLPPAIEGPTPGIPRSHEVIQQRVQLQSPRPKAVEAGLEQVARSPRRLDARFASVPLAEVQFSTRTPDERVDRLVRVPVAEPAQHHTAAVGSTIVIGVLQEQDLGVLPDIDPAVSPLHPGRDIQPLGKNRRAVGRTITVGVLEANDLVVGQVSGKDVGIGGGHGHVHTTGRIPPHGNRRRQSLGIRRKQIDPEPLGNRE